ncbi:MAG: glycosyltransferase [Acidobacteria bacterium]|nr:glycosyltransferase [Acidobacteriota bacterium]
MMQTGQTHIDTRDIVTVSVIIPTHRTRYLAMAADSALRQSISSTVEVIVVDDGSGDDVTGALGTLSRDPRVRILRQANQGAAAARNLGAQAARGAYLAFLDDDDLWREPKLERQLAALRRHPEAGLCFCDGTRIDEQGTHLGRFREPKQWEPGSADEIVFPPSGLSLDVILRGVVITSAIVIRRDVFEQVGGFSPIPAGQDIDLAYRVSRVAALISLQDRLFDYRVTSTSISRSGLRSLLGERAFASRMLEYDLSRAERRTIRRLLGMVECNLAYEYFQARDAPAARRAILAAVFEQRYVNRWSARLLAACLAPRGLIDIASKWMGRQA